MVKKVLYVCYMTAINRQSASKLLSEVINSYGEGSTTIPQKGSRIDLLLSEKPDIVINPVFSRFKNKSKFPCIYFLIHISKPRYIYICSTKCINKRLQRHRGDFVSGKHHATILQRVVNKYGKEKLYYGILDYCYENLEDIEKKYINKYDSHINGYNNTNDTRKNLITEKIINNNIKRNSKPVLMYSINGEFIKEFSSVIAAAKFVDSQSTNISRCCKEKLITIKNRVFRYKSDIENGTKTPYPRKNGLGVLTKSHMELCMQLTSKKVIATYENGFTKIYPSISECERQNGMSKGTLYYKIKNKHRLNSVIYGYYNEDIV